MSDQSIKALNFSVDEVGKHVKASKKRFQWTLSLKGKVHTVTLDYSFISGKVKVVVDKKTLLQNQLPPNVSFQYPFTLDGFSLNCIQQGQNFQLRVNNKVFSHLYNQEKTNSAFRNYQDQIKDIKTDASKFSGTGKIKINIGGGQAKKKGNSKVQSQNWGDLGGNSFPSYFGQQGGSSFSTQSEQVKPAKKSNLLDDDQQSGININNSNIQKTSQEKKQSILNFDNQVKQSKTINNDAGNFFSFDDINFSKTAPSASKSGAVSPNQNQLLNMSSEGAFSKGKSGNIFEVNTITVQANKNSGDLLGDSSINLTSTNNNTNQGSNLIDDFNTMQNMFSTMNVQGNTNNKPQQINFFDEQPKAPQITNNSINNNTNYMNLNMNANNFNTMQNLFQTNQVPQQSANINYAQTQVAYNNINTSPNANVNLNDFNTMQNLFQTNNMGGNMMNMNVNTNTNTNMYNNNYSNISLKVQEQKVQMSNNNNGKIDPNNSDDIFKSMGIDLSKNETNIENNNMFNTVSNPVNMQKNQNPTDWF